MSSRVGGNDGRRASVIGVSGWRCPRSHSSRKGGYQAPPGTTLPSTRRGRPTSFLGPAVSAVRPIAHVREHTRLRARAAAVRPRRGHPMATDRQDIISCSGGQTGHSFNADFTGMFGLGVLSLIGSRTASASRSAGPCRSSWQRSVGRKW